MDREERIYEGSRLRKVSKGTQREKEVIMRCILFWVLDKARRYKRGEELNKMHSGGEERKDEKKNYD
jgi:hypothetical protein